MPNRRVTSNPITNPKAPGPMSKPSAGQAPTDPSVRVSVPLTDPSKRVSGG